MLRMMVMITLSIRWCDDDDGGGGGGGSDVDDNFEVAWQL